MRIVACGVFVAGVVCSPWAAAINKCTGPDGKMTFQDTPCTTVRAEVFSVKPAAGAAPKAAAPSTTATADKASSPASAPPSEASRIEGLVAASQRSRRSNDLRDRLLPDAERDLKKHRDRCDAQQNVFAAQQRIYRARSAEIASEMAAAATMCDQKDRQLKDALDTLEKECTELKCKG